ncbi:hypothetical protein DFH09DRAFT_1081944 [Mycena vulgaris]|nr:hypothetical protein DFH09DRAFT_1081944 [Mycena vulgaris]
MQPIVRWSSMLATTCNESYSLQKICKGLTKVRNGGRRTYTITKKGSGSWQDHIPVPSASLYSLAHTKIIVTSALTTSIRTDSKLPNPRHARGHGSWSANLKPDTIKTLLFFRGPQVVNLPAVKNLPPNFKTRRKYPEIKTSRLKRLLSYSPSSVSPGSNLPPPISSCTGLSLVDGWDDSFRRRCVSDEVKGCYILYNSMQHIVMLTIIIVDIDYSARQLDTHYQKFMFCNRAVPAALRERN